MNRNSVTAPPVVVSPVPGEPPAQNQRGLLVGVIFRAAFKALQANRLRSFLTMLGVIIGVGAVIAAVTLTQGVSANIDQRFASFGTNVLFVSTDTVSTMGVQTGPGSVSSLTIGDASALPGVGNVTAVSPVDGMSGQAVYRNQTWSGGVYGVYPVYQNIANWQIAEGAWFSPGEEAARASDVVLGATVVQTLFGPAGADPIGQTIRINGQVFHVVGTLQAQGKGNDNSIFMPFSTFQQRLSNSPFLNQINIQVDNVNNVAQVQQDATALLEQRHHIQPGTADDFRAFAPNQLIQNAQSNSSVLASLLIGIAAISLTVGGIGIMNIMLVSVSERTREIAIRMAVGARRRDIRGQFLVEAVILSVLGGLFGIIIGLAAGYELVQVVQIPFVVTGFSILLPVAVAAIVGIVFGLYPAALASNLDPIVALRAD